MVKAIDRPKLADGDYFLLIGSFKKLLKDKHTNVIALTVKIIGLLAKGLRERFSTEAKILTEAVLFKLKDKNRAIEREAKATLKNLFFSYVLGGKILETYLEVLKEKTPKLRLSILALIEAYLL